MDIVNERWSAGLLRAEITTLQDNMFRLKIKEKNGLHPRYEVEGALVGDPKEEKYGEKVVSVRASFYSIVSLVARFREKVEELK